jgi:hypothetical protein
VLAGKQHHALAAFVDAKQALIAMHHADFFENISPSAPGFCGKILER